MGEDLPPRSLTSVTEIYATAAQLLLFGRARSQSHFLLNLSLPPHIANPYRQSLSWPSQHQTSLGPSEVRGTHLSLRAVGVRISAATGSSSLCTGPTVFLAQFELR